MNITQTFRRKNKYHKPIIVFKELYRDYFQHTSPNQHRQSDPSQQSLAIIDKKKCLSKNSDTLMPKVPKTNSSEQLSKYLQKYGDPGTSLLKFTQEESTLKRSKSSQNNTYIFKLLDRNQLQELQKDKRTYFPNLTPKVIHFLKKPTSSSRKRPLKIRRIMHQKFYPKYSKNQGLTARNPYQKESRYFTFKSQLQELKRKFIDRKQMAVQKFEKIRYNFLLKKNYKPQNQTEQTLTHRNLSQKNMFQVTKQNIFPQACS